MPGEVPERLNGRDWKSRSGGQPRSRVRIPPSPLQASKRDGIRTSSGLLARAQVRGIGTAHLSDTRLRKEVDYRLGAALRLVLEEEMACALEQHELGAGNLPREAGRVVEREVLVLLAPQDQCGHPECREPFLVGLEFVEV